MSQPNITAAPATTNFLHYNPERIDYAVSEAELESMKNGSDSLWKDFCLTCVGVGVPCLINAVSEWRAMKGVFDPNLTFTLNSIVGLVGIALGLAFGIAWGRGKCSVSTLIGQIKARPRMQL